MTTTWLDFLADLREELQDTSTTPRWTDAYLFSRTKDSIREYSSWFPRRIDRVALTASGSGYTLPTDFVEDINLEVPQDTYLTRRNAEQGKSYLSGGALSHYYTSGGKLYMNATNEGGDAVLLTYFAVHSLPASVTDAVFTFSVPEMDMELIRLYVEIQVHSQMRAKQSRLDRFEQGSGRRDDNPLLPETNSEYKEYYQKIAQRLRGGAVMLYYTGRS